MGLISEAANVNNSEVFTVSSVARNLHFSGNGRNGLSRLVGTPWNQDFTVDAVIDVGIFNGRKTLANTLKRPIVRLFYSNEFKVADLETIHKMSVAAAKYANELTLDWIEDFLLVCGFSTVTTVMSSPYHGMKDVGIIVVRDVVDGMQDKAMQLAEAANNEITI